MNFSGILGVYYREIQALRTRFMRSIVASMVSPALFLIAFGYGIGRYQQVASLSYLEFLFAGLLAMSTLNTSYGINTELNIARFYFKTFDEYLTAPVPRWQIVVGEMLYGITKGWITAVFFIAYALFKNMSLSFNAVTVLVLLVHMAVFSLLGFIVAVTVKNHGDQFAINTFLITPMTFLSGVFFPLEQAPALLKYIVQAFPITHSLILLRQAMTHSPLSLYNIAALGVFTVLLFFAALYFASRTEG